jgi:hypothetical protein
MHISTSDGGEFEITEVLAKAWSTRFPHADLAREHPLMVLWITKHPARAPKSGVRFVEAWLKREHETAGKALAEGWRAGRLSAEKIGQKYDVKPNPGESQEAFNLRVIRAAAVTAIRRVA